MFWFSFKWSCNQRPFRTRLPARNLTAHCSRLWPSHGAKGSSHPAANLTAQPPGKRALVEKHWLWKLGLAHEATWNPHSWEGRWFQNAAGALRAVIFDGIETPQALLKEALQYRSSSSGSPSLSKALATLRLHPLKSFLGQQDDGWWLLHKQLILMWRHDKNSSTCHVYHQSTDRADVWGRQIWENANASHHSIKLQKSKVPAVQRCSLQAIKA